MAKQLPLLKPTSTADRVASILREQILTTKEGSYMGLEADLSAEIGVSLPTLRQAARMLEHEQLLKIKPGKGGGYFTRRPNIETAINSASQYLSSKDLVSNASFLDAADAVVTRIIEKAVLCEDEALLAELQQFITDQRKNSRNLLPPEESFRDTIVLMNLLGRMSDNILLELFSRILWNEVSISRTTGTFEESLDIVKTNYLTRLRVAEAVLAQNKEKALKAWQKRVKFLRSWPQRGLQFKRKRDAS